MGCFLQKVKYNKILLGLIVFGLISALLIGYERNRIEQTSKTVEILMEYEGLAKLARQSGKPVDEVLLEFKDRGVTSLAVYETTLQKLEASGLVTLALGSDLINAQRNNSSSTEILSQFAQKQEIAANNIYILFEYGEVYEEVLEDLKLRFGDQNVQVFSGDKPIVSVYADFKDMYKDSPYKQDLGILTSDLREAARLGFMVVARPTNYETVNPEQINSFFRRLDKSQVHVSAILFSGTQSLGAMKNLPITAKNMLDRNMTLAMAEHITQLQFAPMVGVTEMAALLDYKIARLYVIDKLEQSKITVEAATRRWALTDEERNVRINFIRPFEKLNTVESPLEVNLKYVDDIVKSVQKRDLQIGKASLFETYFPEKLLMIPIVFGVMAISVLYLSLLIKMQSKTQIGLTIILGTLTSIMMMLGSGLLIRQGLAFASAVIFPAVVMDKMLDIWEKKYSSARTSILALFMTATGQLTLAVILSLVGGLYLGGILTDSRFMLELDIYRGVKLTFLMPLILISLVYLNRYNIFTADKEKDICLIKQVKALFNQPIYIKTLVIFAVGAIVAWIFVGRSGHSSGVPVPAWEIKLRLFLEEVMYARPREKEFLVGHPAFYLAAFATARQLPKVIHFAFVVAATIGQGSLIQTFAHMRTPILMSLVRALDGLAMGIGIGIFVIFVCSIAYPYMNLVGRRLSSDE